MKKPLTSDQTARLNATLKRLAEDLERKKKEREAGEKGSGS